MKPNEPFDEPLNIDFELLLESLNLKNCAVAELAKVSPAMWYLVKTGRRNFSAHSRFTFLYGLARHLDYKNLAKQLQRIEEELKSFEKELQKQFPLKENGYLNESG